MHISNKVSYAGYDLISWALLTHDHYSRDCFAGSHFLSEWDGLNGAFGS